MVRNNFQKSYFKVLNIAWKNKERLFSNLSGVKTVWQRKRINLFENPAFGFIIQIKVVFEAFMYISIK